MFRPPQTCTLGVAAALVLGHGARAAQPEWVIAQPAVKAAFEFIQRDAAANLDTQIRLCEIPAPPFHESARAAAMLAIFKAAHLQQVRIDASGNVIGERPGHASHPHLALAAHLDTVFPEGTDVHVTREGTVLKGAGIYDDCRGLAALTGVMRALDDAKIETSGSITFVADVGEEGLGDLRGMKELFNKTLPGQIDAFVSIDGPAMLEDVVNTGVGSYRFRLSYSGPGGHSFASFGIANPIHALGRAIAKIDEIRVPDTPKTTFNVGRIGGGTSVNTIAESAFAEIDMRSSARESLDGVRAAVERAAQSALDDENGRWSDRGKLRIQLESLGFRPPGQTSASSDLVKTAAAVNPAMGLPATKLSAQSTDANLPMSLGIPAITIGGGGAGTGAHTLAESMDTKDAWKGTQRILLLAVSMLD